MTGFRGDCEANKSQKKQKKEENNSLANWQLRSTVFKWDCFCVFVIFFYACVHVSTALGKHETFVGWLLAEDGEPWEK